MRPATRGDPDNLHCTDTLTLLLTTGGLKGTPRNNINMLNTL